MAKNGFKLIDAEMHVMEPVVPAASPSPARAIVSGGRWSISSSL